MYTEESTDFILTHKEQEMLRQLRTLSDKDRKEVEEEVAKIAAEYME